MTQGIKKSTTFPKGTRLWTPLEVTRYFGNQSSFILDPRLVSVLWLVRLTSDRAVWVRVLADGQDTLLWQPLPPPRCKHGYQRISCEKGGTALQWTNIPSRVKYMYIILADAERRTQNLPYLPYRIPLDVYSSWCTEPDTISRLDTILK